MNREKRQGINELSFVKGDFFQKSLIDEIGFFLNKGSFGSIYQITSDTSDDEIEALVLRNTEALILLPFTFLKDSFIYQCLNHYLNKGGSAIVYSDRGADDIISIIQEGDFQYEAKIGDFLNFISLTKEDHFNSEFSMERNTFIEGNKVVTKTYRDDSRNFLALDDFSRTKLLELYSVEV